MSYVSRESSRSYGEPVSFYLFRYGPEPTSIYAFTDAEFAVNVAVPGYAQPVQFDPVPISRGDFETNGSFEQNKLDITLDDQVEICTLFYEYPPSDIVIVSIYEGHLEDGEIRGVWFGRVIGFGSADESTARLTCESSASSLKRPALRRHYQYGCPLVLYGPDCRANEAAATVNITVSSASGGIVVLPAGWAATQDNYIGGIARWTRADGRTERRTIIAASATQVTLAGQALGLLGGMTIALSLGCKHTMDDCRNLHNNILNYGGQPWIPLKNPIGFVNNFY